ncbi:hypothetical protein C4J87_0053 [Pseudomonas sp. R1-43-08]|nr:hypothetical protein C4J87_0053 [Pseudomonas sp. R1-43-08]
MILIRHGCTSSCGHGLISRFWEQREDLPRNGSKDRSLSQTMITNDSRLSIEERASVTKTLGQAG